MDNAPLRNPSHGIQELLLAVDEAIMTTMAPSRGLVCCCKRAVRFAWSQTPRRSLTTIHVGGPVEKLDLPTQIPREYWSQLPQRLRPDHGM